MSEETAVAMDGADHRAWPQTASEFEALIAEYQDALVNFAFWRLGNFQDAEDAVQEVFLRAYSRRARLPQVPDPGPYLYRMVLNRCTDVLRKRGRTRAVTRVLARDEVSMPELDVEQRRIGDLLAGIPEREADVIRLRVFSDLAFDEIARATGANVSTTKSRFRYGLRKLRKLLDGGDGR